MKGKEERKAEGTGKEGAARAVGCSPLPDRVSVRFKKASVYPIKPRPCSSSCRCAACQKGEGEEIGMEEEDISERSLRCFPPRWSQQELGLRKALSSLGAANAGAGATPLENSGLRGIFSSKPRRLKGLGLCHDKPGYFAALRPLRYRVGLPLPFQ